MKAYWVALACSLSLPALAETEHPLLPGYAEQARQDNPAFAGFSAERGKTLYFAEQQRDGKTMSCTTCHTADPRQSGKTLAYRKVEPLAPVANPKRFSNPKKVEKWFRRNCDDVFTRECSAQEKGDFITWINSLK
jgi:cytochrome c peroxidase